MAQGGQYGVGRSAHPALQRQERLRYDAPLHVLHQECGHVVAYLRGHGVFALEGPCLVGDVALHHSHNIPGVNLDIRLAYPVAHLRQRYRLAQGRVLQLIDVVQVLGAHAVERVMLQDDVLCQPGRRRTDAPGRGEVGLAGVCPLLHVAHFEYGPVHLTHEPVAQLLRHLAQVNVVVGNLSRVNMAAEVGVGGVGRTVAYGHGVRQVAVGAMTASCSATAIFASSFVTALAAPEGVNPLSAMFSPFLINAAASAAVSRVYAIS